MKKIIIGLVIALPCQLLHAQSVGIGTASPNASAQLDITSTTKGLLLPRMTSTQRTAIASPAAGLMVFETTSNSTWIFNGAGWVQLASGGASPWATSGSNIYNTNTGNMGVGLSSLINEKFTLKGNALITFVNAADIIGGGANASLRMMSAGAGNSNIRFLEPDSSLGASVSYAPTVDVLSIANGINSQAAARFYNNGNVGIGASPTNNAVSKLQVEGGSDVDLATQHGYLMLGEIQDLNLVMSNYQIQARENGVAAPLYLQNSGGSVGIGNTGAIAANTRLHIATGFAGTLASNGYLMLGQTTAQNIAISNNNIQARNNGAAADLDVQNFGGNFKVQTNALVVSNSSVGIGTAAPNASALLDITSTAKGLLMPRMTTAQRNAIASPATGLMVFDTNLTSFYFYNGSVWSPVNTGGGSSKWTLSGTDIYNNNAGNVGIGISIPASKLHLVGNLLQDNGTMTLNNPAGIVQFQNAGVSKGYIQLSGDNLRMGTNTGNNLGNFVVSMDGNDKVIVDSTGNMQILGERAISLTQNGYLTLGANSSSNIVFDNHGLQARINGSANPLLLQTYGGDVGVGVLFPGEKLDIAGSVKLRSGSSEIKFETNQAAGGIPKYSPGISFMRTGTTSVLGSMEYVDTLGFANFMRFRMGEDIKNGLTINTSNYVGVGTADPLAKMHVRGASGIDEIAVNSGAIGESATIQFYNTLIGGINGVDKTAFVQLDGDDLMLGANSGNSTGKLVIRMNGTNRVFVTNSGNVGIGHDSPTEKLYVAGNALLNATNPIFQLQNSGVDKGFVQLSGDNIRIGTNGGNAAGKFVIRTNGGDRFFVDGSGNVNIGSQTDAPGFIFRVGGKMICEEVKVKLQSSGWPDYVFSDQYKLPTLSELNDFIKLNKHLPNVPPAAAVEKNGLEIGDMQKRMMEKIEELTLYIIQQQKEIDLLKLQIKNN